MFDVIITVKDQSELFVNAPFIVGKEIGSAEYAAQNGLASVCAENEGDAYAKIAKLIALLPSNNEDGVVAEEITDDINRVVSVEGLSGKALVEVLADASDFIEIGASYAKETVVGFASFGGVTCGVIASNSAENGGVITCDGAKKAARMVSLCDSFSIPVITLVDSIGVEVSGAAEGAPLASQLGKLAMAYATADTAKITVVVGKAYGAGFTLLGSKSLGADLEIALEDAVISVMSPESAVAFLMNDKITAEKSRADVEAEWCEKYASAVNAAENGDVDDVVNEETLRARICSALYMLAVKADGAPERKYARTPV
jgi:acetyl-CoA carboxylase carboxyltransferase component